MQLCATRDLPRGWEMTANYADWQPTGALNRGHRRDGSWIEGMLKRSPFAVARARRQEARRVRKRRKLAEGEGTDV